MYTAEPFLDMDLDYFNWSIFKENDINNYSGLDDEDDEDNDIDWLKKITVTLFCIIFALGIIGNGLVIWIAGFMMKKTIRAVWILNLAIADFLCCASLPLRITEWVHISSFIDTDDFCITNIILFNLNGSASVLLLMAMSIDRCVLVMWPFWAKLHRTCNLVRITAAIIWLISSLLTGLVLYFYAIYFKDVNEWCVDAKSYDDHSFHSVKLTIRLLRLFMMFVIPFLIILISYIIILIKIRKCKRSQRSQRPYRIITAVILGFFICWLPYYIWPLTHIYDDSENDIRFYKVNIPITTLACLNSCINPIIYVFMAQDVKPGFLRSIPSRVERALSDCPHDQCRDREDYEHSHTTDA